MATKFTFAFPAVPEHRWNHDHVGHDGDLDEGTARSFHEIDASTGPEAKDPA